MPHILKVSRSLHIIHYLLDIFKKDSFLRDVVGGPLQDNIF